MNRCPKCDGAAYRLIPIENTGGSTTLVGKRVCLDCDETWLEPFT